MPSKSAKQRRTMLAAVHDANFARKMGIPQSVAREFVKADKRKKRRNDGDDIVDQIYRANKRR